MNWRRGKVIVLAVILTAANWAILWLTVRRLPPPLAPNYWGIGGGALAPAFWPIILVVAVGLPLRSLAKRRGRPQPDLWKGVWWVMLVLGLLMTARNVLTMGRFG